jgi:uncharacterized protein (DUF58 family)
MAVGGVLLMAAPVVPAVLVFALVVDVAFAMLLMADAFLVRRGHDLTATRTHDEILSLGTPNLITVAVENPTPIGFQIALRDALPDSSECTDTYSAKGWLSAYGTFSLAYHVQPMQRGEHAFGGLTVRIKTALGLWVVQREVVAPAPVKVYPNIQQTKQQSLLMRKMRMRQMGLRALRLRGQGAEFESLRDYMPDDELRKVDWKASARRGAMVTREYDVERSQSIMLVLDLGRTMATHLDFMTKLDYAVNAGVLLTYAATQATDRVGVMAFAEDVLAFSPPAKGGAQMSRVLEQLYPLQPRQVESNYKAAFTFLARHQRKRSLIVLFTDLVDPDSSKRLMDNLTLLHPQHLVLCVALSDYELRTMLAGAPGSPTGMYQQAVAASVLEDRQLALAQLHQRGILTVDAAPSDLSVAVVNRYLGIKREGRV